MFHAEVLPCIFVGSIYLSLGYTILPVLFFCTSIILSYQYYLQWCDCCAALSALLLYCCGAPHCDQATSVLVLSLCDKYGVVLTFYFVPLVPPEREAARTTYCHVTPCVVSLECLALRDLPDQLFIPCFSKGSWIR